jgi:type IV pilus assembly protein PilA
MLKLLRNRIQDDKGFTLIELMVVVLIIAILIAIAIPTFLGLRERAQDRGAQAELRDGLTAAKAFYTDDETYGDGAGAGADFDDAAAEAIEPSLDWAGGEPNINSAAGDTVVLTQESESGTFFCIQDDEGETFYGEGATEAAAVTACTASEW